MTAPLNRDTSGILTTLTKANNGTTPDHTITDLEGVAAHQTAAAIPGRVTVIASTARPTRQWAPHTHAAFEALATVETWDIAQWGYTTRPPRWVNHTPIRGGWWWATTPDQPTPITAYTVNAPAKQKWVEHLKSGFGDTTIGDYRLARPRATVLTASTPLLRTHRFWRP